MVALVVFAVEHLDVIPVTFYKGYGGGLLFGIFRPLAPQCISTYVCYFFLVLWIVVGAQPQLAVVVAGNIKIVGPGCRSADETPDPASVPVGKIYRSLKFC